MYFKKLLAATLAATMVLGSSMMVFAEDQEASKTGKGSTEYVAVGDVFDVVFPTDAGNAFDYIVDPNGLIEDTAGAKYAGMKIEKNGTVFFQRTGTKPEGIDIRETGTATVELDYAVSSNEIRVTNKSTEDVDIKVTAKAEAGTGIKMAASQAALTSETEPALYLGLKSRMIDGTTTPVEVEQAITDTEEGTVSNPSIPCDEDAYEVKWVGDRGQYEKVMKANYTGFTSYSFYLVGACNDSEGWTALKDKAPKVDLVWSVKDTITGAGATDDYKMVAGANGAISYTFVDKPTGSVTALNISGVDRLAAYTGGNITYNAATGVLSVNSTAATKTGLVNGGTLAITIGGKNYTLTYTK